MLIHQDIWYCSNCFNALAAGEQTCPACGFNDGAAAVSRLAVALPQGTILLGKYVIGRVLGKGGFGMTYLAFDLAASRKVAIKEYLPDTLIHRNTGETAVTSMPGEKGDAFRDGAEKFYEEARTISRFSGHPNIVKVYEFFYENNTAYFAMEFVEGCDLKHYVAARGGRLSERDCLAILEPLLDALELIHAAGVLHRDISPDNLFMTSDGNVKLLDFGSARQVLGEQSQSLSVVLKPGFAPFEQYQSHGRQGPWTDLYALSATLYWCLTGQIPLPAMDRIENDKLPALSLLGCKISKGFEDALMKCLQIRSANRYQSAAALRSAVDFSVLHPAAGKSIELSEKAEKDQGSRSRFAMHHKKLAILAAGVVLVAVVAVSASQLLAGSGFATRPSDGAKTTTASSDFPVTETTVSETAATVSETSALPAATPSAAAGEATVPVSTTAAPTTAATSAQVLSGNNKLKTLIINTCDVSDCLLETCDFSYLAGYSEKRLKITAEPADDGATVKISGDGISTDLKCGAGNETTITVTAENGSRKVYKIYTLRDTPATPSPTPDPAKNHYDQDPANSSSQEVCLSLARLEYSGDSLIVTMRVYNNLDKAITGLSLTGLTIKDSSGQVVASFTGSFTIAASLSGGEYADFSLTLSGSQVAQSDAWLPTSTVSSSRISYSY